MIKTRIKNKKIKIISKIVNEVTSYYLLKGAKNFQIKIDIDEGNQNNYAIYTFGYLNLSENEVSELKKALTIHKDEEYDQYWGLMGEGENADEFMLIARLCDEVIINYEEGILELGLRK